MFALTGYEAALEYLGLSFHSKVTEFLTSQMVFQATLLLIFGWMFFSTTVKFASRYLPSSLIKRTSVPLSQYFKIMLWLFLGLALLKTTTTTGIHNLKGKSWHENSYVMNNYPDVVQDYKISFIFDLIIRTSDEMTKLVARLVDSLFSSSNSELEAPNYFYKAVMYAGTQAVEDPKLKRAITSYMQECFPKVIPIIPEVASYGLIDKLFGRSDIVDEKLSQVVVGHSGDEKLTCLDMKTDVVSDLWEYSVDVKNDFKTNWDSVVRPKYLGRDGYINFNTSSFLANHLLEQKEWFLGLDQAAVPQGTLAKIFLGWSRIRSLDGVFSMTDMTNDLVGSQLAAKRAQEFHENLIRAPMVAGFTRMVLLAVAPFLVFFVVAGHWKALIWWALSLTSVGLWLPIQTFIRHVMNYLALASNQMKEFGVTDGISPLGAILLQEKVYQMSAVGFWIMVFIGPIFTALMLWFLRPLLTDTQPDPTPEAVEDSKGLAGGAAKKGASLIVG